MSNFGITKRRINNVLILDINGKLRLNEGSADFHTALRLLKESGERNILLNLAEVSSIDSTGLGELVAGYAALQKNEGKLKLLQITDRVRELLVITKLSTIFEIYENESEAVKSFKNSSGKTNEYKQPAIKERFYEELS